MWRAKNVQRTVTLAVFEMFFKVNVYKRSSSLSVLLCLSNLLPSQDLVTTAPASATTPPPAPAVVPFESVLVRAKKLTGRFPLGLAPAGRGGMGVG